MPRRVLPLTDSEIKSAKPEDKTYKLTDGLGLWLDVKPNGSKLWRFKYRFLGEDKTAMSFGAYPELTLANARLKRDEARLKILNGIDPGEEKKAAKKAEKVRGFTFESLAQEWFAYNAPRWAESTAYKVKLYLDNDILPIIGSRVVKSITRPELVDLVRVVERRGTLTAAGKIRQWLHQIFRFGLAKGIVDSNPSTDLDIVAAPPKAVRHHPHITFEELPELLSKLETTNIHLLTRSAIHLLILTAARPGELRSAPWTEFDLENAIWTIPKERMKARRPHIIPLPVQAVEILEQLKKYSGSYTLVFPGEQNLERPMSENTVNKALRLMGYKDKQTGHGFRHLLSTELNGRGYSKDWIELQLAHSDKNKIRETYNHATYLEQRRVMMQEWADSIDALQDSSNVIHLKRA
ncbi:MAG TPA: integrase arm-type DNA-binding domain-containing protein [Cellvibrio sp.]|nr:integrase arm-type DNA-binding domain-containing protein [Cellvibrio sp.]